MNRNLGSNVTESTQNGIVVLNGNSMDGLSLLQIIVHFEREIIEKLDKLYQIRLVQKLARPIQKTKKVQLTHNFKQILEQIHKKMSIISEQLDLSSLAYSHNSLPNPKEKQKIETSIHTKLLLFSIRKKYLEVLINSSFVHFSKVAQVHGLYDGDKGYLKVIDIEKWLSLCLGRLGKEGGEGEDSLCC